LNEIQKYRDTFEISDSESDAIFLDSTEKNLQQGTTDKSKEFLEFTEKLENQWHPDQKGQFAKLWPEIAKAL
jgi:hypothetical protein